MRLGEEVSHGTMEFVRFERTLVTDLCVDEANHYITDTGLINKNTRVYVEELTHWPSPVAPDKMKATLRSAAGVPCRYRATANPGGPGHLWVKARYIDPAPAGRTPIEDEAGHLQRMFIPARVTDNQILLLSDPGYVDRLKLTGSAALVKAWLDGDWNVIEGAFFNNWSTHRHVTPAFEIPKHWMRFRSADWGSMRPFAIHWHAIATEDTKLLNGMYLPRGGMVMYREWYGAEKPNVGLKLTAEVVGLGILQRSEGEEYSYSVLDPAAFAQDGGPSIAERIAKGSGGKVLFRPADNKRVGPLGHIAGWDLCRHRLDGEAPDRPMFVAFDNCDAFIRTVPLLQHDPTRVEDVDTDAEDHAGDSWRYACASRPWIKPLPKSEQPLTTLKDVTLNTLWKKQGSGGLARRV